MPYTSHVLKLTTFFIAVFLMGCAAPRVPEQRFEYTRPQMGVPFRIVLYAVEKFSADAAAEAAFTRIQRLNDVLSDYDTDSELSRLSQTAGQGKAVPVSDELWLMLRRSQELARDTGGAFDITCGPAVSLWRKARRVKEMPDAEKLAEARRAVGFEKLRLDENARTAKLLVPYMRLDLGGIAKGYAVDEALRVLREHGVRSALVSGGGDFAASHAPPGADGWRIQLAPLNATTAPAAESVLLRNRALATSGDVFQHVEIDGVRYSHIVDPRTGIGLTDRSLVFIIAQDCTLADSLATSVSVLGPDAGLKFAESKGACVRVLRQPADSIEVRQSACFKNFLAQ